MTDIGRSDQYYVRHTEFSQWNSISPRDSWDPWAQCGLDWPYELEISKQLLQSSMGIYFFSLTWLTNRIFRLLCVCCHTFQVITCQTARRSGPCQTALEKKLYKYNRSQWQKKKRMAQNRGNEGLSCNVAVNVDKQKGMESPMRRIDMLRELFKRYSNNYKSLAVDFSFFHAGTALCGGDVQLPIVTIQGLSNRRKRVEQQQQRQNRSSSRSKTIGAQIVKGHLNDLSHKLSSACTSLPEQSVYALHALRHKINNLFLQVELFFPSIFGWIMVVFFVYSTILRFNGPLSYIGYKKKRF